LKLQDPLWRLSSTHPVRKKLADLGNDERAKLKTLLSHDGRAKVSPHAVKWWEGLQERVQELRPLFDTEDKNYVAFVTLLDRFLLAVNVKDFFRELLDHVKRSHALISYSLIETILIGRENKGKFVADTPIILDVSDWTDAQRYSNRVASTQIEQYMSECLFRAKSTSAIGESCAEHVGLSALSGAESVLVD
jgi:hypothetical protein